MSYKWAKYRTIIHFPFLLGPCFLPFYTIIPILYATNFLIENVFIICDIMILSKVLEECFGNIEHIFDGVDMHLSALFS